MQYPTLYNIVHRKQVTVANVFSEIRRSLTGNKWDKWLELVQRLMDVRISNEKDMFVWNLTPSGIFTVKSMYLD